MNLNQTIIDEIEDKIINKIAVIKCTNQMADTNEIDQAVINKHCDLIVDYIRTLRDRNATFKEEQNQ